MSGVYGIVEEWNQAEYLCLRFFLCYYSFLLFGVCCFCSRGSGDGMVGGWGRDGHSYSSQGIFFFQVVCA